MASIFQAHGYLTVNYWRGEIGCPKTHGAFIFDLRFGNSDLETPIEYQRLHSYLLLSRFCEISGQGDLFRGEYRPVVQCWSVWWNTLLWNPPSVKTKFALVNVIDFRSEHSKLWESRFQGRMIYGTVGLSKPVSVRPPRVPVHLHPYGLLR